MEDFVAYDSRGFSVFLLLMAGVIFICGLWMVGIFGTPPHSPRFSDGVIFVAGWFFVLFSGFCGFELIKIFLDPSEQLRIGPRGVRFANWSEDTIPGSENTRVSTWSGPKLRLIVLYLRNPDRFPGRGLARMIAANNRELSGGDIFLNLAGTNRSFAEAISAIQRFKPVD